MAELPPIPNTSPNPGVTPVSSDTNYPGMPDLSQSYSPFVLNSQEKHYQSSGEKAVDFAKFAIPSAAAGFAETVGSSLGMIDDQQLSNYLIEHAGQFGDYHARNKEWTSTLGDIGGMFLPGMQGVHAIRAGGLVYKVISAGTKSKLLNSVFSTGMKTDELIRGVKARDLYLAKRGNFTPSTEPIRKLFASRAIQTKLLDSVKESVAFEAAVLGTMSSSDTLYPDEFSVAELGAMQAAGTGIVAGAEHLFMRRAIRQSLASVAHLAYGRANPAKLPLDEIINRPGARDVGITIHSATAMAAKQEAENSASRMVKENMNKVVLSAEQEVKHQIENLGTDNIIPGFTNKNAPDKMQVNTLFNMEMQSPFSILGAYGTDDIGNAKTLIANRDKTAKQLDIEMQKLTAKNNGAPVTSGPSPGYVRFYHGGQPYSGGKRWLTQDQNYAVEYARKSQGGIVHYVDIDESSTFLSKSFDDTGTSTKSPYVSFEASEEISSKLKPVVKTASQGNWSPEDVKAFDDLRDKYNTIKSTEFYVAEPGGNLVRAQDRKPTYWDDPVPIEVQRATQAEPTMFTVNIGGGIYGGAGKRVIAATADGILVVPPIKQDAIKLGGINVTKILSSHEVSQQSEHFKLLLKDMGEDWHTRHGKRGKEIFQSLPADIQREVGTWTGNSGASKLRDWASQGHENFQILYNSQEPMRRRLYELADADGTIPLFRGESKLETARPTNDVVSMTSSPEVAKAFGHGNVIVRRVPVNDVVMIVGGLGQEFEYIVKGNLKRNVGSEVNTSPGGFEALTLAQRTAGYAALNKAVESWGKAKNPSKIYISPNSHYTQMDFAQEIYRRYGDRTEVVLPNGWDKSHLEFASVRSKYTDYVRMRKVINETAGGGIKLSDDQKLNLEDLRKMLNLPGTDDGDLHPLIKVYESLFAQGTENLSSVFKDIAQVRSAMTAFDMLPKLSEFNLPAINVTGNMLRVPADEKAVLLLKKPVTPDMRTREHIVQATETAKSLVHQQFQTAANKGAPLVSALYRQMTEELAPLTAAARDVTSLAEGAQKTSGQFFGQLMQQAENVRDIKAAHAMSMLGDMTDRRARKIIGEQIMAPVLDVVQRLKATNSKADLTQFNLFVHAKREGWRVLPDAIQTGDKFSYKLDPSFKFNKEKWKKIYGTEMPEDAMLPAPTRPRPDGTRDYQPLAISQLAHAGVSTVSALSIRVLRETNFLREVAGQGRINEQAFHMPPKNFSRQETVFLLSPTGDIHSTHAGRSHAEAMAKAQKAQELLAPGFIKVDRKNVEQYYDIRDRAFEEKMMDFSDPLAQTGAAKGTQVGPIIDMGDDVLTEIMETLNHQFESIIRRTRASIFESEIQYARSIYNQAWAQDKAVMGGTIWQQYLAFIFGNSTLHPNSVLGKNYFAMENFYDKALQSAHDKVLSKINPRALIPKKGGENGALYKQLSEQIGVHNPFQDATDFMKRTHKLELPTNMKQHMATLSNTTSFLVLRFMDLGHAILNMTSLMATTPAVIKALARGVDEAEEAWRTRIGAFGTAIDGNHAYLNPTRALMSGIHDMFTKKGKEIWERASKQGYFDQDVDFIFRTLTAPGQGYAANLVSNAARLTSILSDKSEKLARAISFMTGYNIAKRGLGLQHDGAAFAFANKFANDNIGDYRANNRPNIFQGAVGMPLGLFTTFFWNYYQRLFSYIERGDRKALATQYATQASVFGAQGVPGFQQFVDLFGSNYDGTANPVDAMRNRFGDQTTDYVLYGALSNLPKIFGADDGIALHTRGDITVRGVPNILQLENTPGYRMVADTTTAMAKFLKQINEREGVSYQQTMETLAAYSPNRFIKNMAILAGGYSTDRRGQVVNDDVYSEMSIVSRAFGLRPLQEAKKVEGWSRIRATQLSQQERMMDLRDRARSNARSGNLSAEELSDMAGNYVRYGGNPAYFSRWLRDQYMAGLVDKTQMELIKAIKDPTRGYDVQRLLSAIGTSPNDPEFSR